MIIQIIILLILFLLIVPIPIGVELQFQVLKLSGEIKISVLKIFKIRRRVKFRGQYVYITNKKGTRREKLTSKNYNVAFILQFVRQTYFRILLRSLSFSSSIGYFNNSMVTALATSQVDIISKSLLAKIAHNKKSSHIFVNNEAKYNQDCFNVKLQSKISISIFDMIYTLINTLISLKGETYEAGTKQYEQSERLD